MCKISHKYAKHLWDAYVWTNYSCRYVITRGQTSFTCVLLITVSIRDRRTVLSTQRGILLKLDGFVEMTFDLVEIWQLNFWQWQFLTILAHISLQYYYFWHELILIRVSFEFSYMPILIYVKLAHLKLALLFLILWYFKLIFNNN